VAVYDVFTEVFLALQEFVADPQQVGFPLHYQRDARLDAGMNKKEISTGETQTQALQELVMLRRHRRLQLSDQGTLLLVTRVG
jgi:hypothetical protein